MKSNRSSESGQSDHGGESAAAESQGNTSQGSGATVAAGALPYQALPDGGRKADEQWGKLPTKLAKDLTDGRRESVAGDYRNAVETYFRVIAEKAREKSNKQ